MPITQAKESDSIELTNITLQSKDYWNYGEEQIEKWREQLTITPEYINSKNVFKLIKDDRIAGYYSFHIESNLIIKLENLFIAPEFIGSGIGKELMIDLFKKSLDIGFKRLILDSEPNAEGFYSKFGFSTFGQMATSIENRYLPMMEISYEKVNEYLKLI